MDYKVISHNLTELECYRRYLTHVLLRNSGIYFGQPPIIKHLCETGTCTQNELAKAVNVSPASVAVSVKRMQKSGLIDKVSDENDMRRNKISITEKGRALDVLINSRFDELDKKMYGGFTEKELEQLDSYIIRITANLSKDAPDKSRMFEIMKKEFSKPSGGEEDA